MLFIVRLKTLYMLQFLKMSEEIYANLDLRYRQFSIKNDESLASRLTSPEAVLKIRLEEIL